MNLSRRARIECREPVCDAEATKILQAFVNTARHLAAGALARPDRELARTFYVNAWTGRPAHCADCIASITYPYRMTLQNPPGLAYVSAIEAHVRYRGQEQTLNRERIAKRSA
jgi:hypothetical protein